MKPSKNPRYLLFGGTFVLANKLQLVGDKMVKDLSTKQWFLLRNIMEMPQQPLPTITQIAKEMDTSRQNVAKMLVKMERDGLVAIQQDGSDKRSRCVCITQAGIDNARLCVKNSKNFFDTLFDEIDTQDIEIAGKVLVKMIENLQIMQEKCDKSED